MSKIEGMGGATENVDSQYDNEAMSIGGGIDPRLKGVTFEDYQTGKEIQIGSKEHYNYFKREQGAENADMMVKEDIKKLLNTLNTLNNDSTPTDVVLEKEKDITLFIQYNNKGDEIDRLIN